MQKLYLASTSIWRLGLLKSAGFVVELLDPQVDEDPLFGQTPIETAEIRAKAKAISGHSKIEGDGLVIGADQVVHLNGVAYGKPVSDQDWFDRLKDFRGKTHLLSTAVALQSSSVSMSFVETTKIRFRADLLDEELWAYVRFGEAKGCAGGYMMEKRGAWLIESIEGDWQNVIGLPIFPLITALKSLGWRFDHLSGDLS